MTAQIISLDPQQRAADLVANWKVQPLHVLSMRCEALRAMQANGIRLPGDVYSAWLQMSAIVLVGLGRE